MKTKEILLKHNKERILKILFTNHWSLKKQVIGLLLIPFWFFCLPQIGKASHIIGGELTYKCLGGGQYEVTLDVFRDCFYGIASFDDPAHIGIFNELGLIQTINVSPIFIDTIPTDVGDPCLNVPPDVCVDWARYRDTVYLDPGAVLSEGFKLVYQRCCRNQTISNIIEPDSTGATYFVDISPDSYNDCNSSPTFVEDENTFTYPPVFVCVGKPIVYDHSATDIDGDSLSYKMCTPFEGASFNFSQPPVPADPPYDNVVWNPPYNVDNMLGGPYPLQIHPTTGLLTGTPTIQGQFVVGICVEEWRDGELLSIVRRDFQYNVGLCTEVIAEFEGPEAQCDNLTVQFENQSELATNYLWYPQFPQMDFVSTSENLTWTYPDTGTYTVCMIAQPFAFCADTICHEVFLQYNSTVADFNYTTFDCADSSVVILQDLSGDEVSPIVSWDWELEHDNITYTSNEQEPTFIVPNPSTGTIKLTVKTENGCERTKVDIYATNQNNPTSQIDPNVDICFGDSIALNPNLAGIDDFVYQWESPIGTDEINPVVAPQVTTTYPVTITAFNGLCSTDFEVEVNVMALPELSFTESSDCEGRTITFTNTSENAVTFNWDFGDGSPSESGFFPTHTYDSLGTYSVTLTTGAFDMCPDTLVKEIEVIEKILDANFDFEYVDCKEDEITIGFTDLSINNLNNTIIWSWQFENNGISISQNPQLTISSEQTIDVGLTIFTNENCTDTITRTLDLDFIEFDFPDSVKVCWNESMELNPNGSGDYQYLWLPAEGLDDNTRANPTASPDETTTYMVYIQNIAADTCEIVKEVTVYVPEPIDLQTNPDVLTCDAETNLIASTSVQNVNLNWTNAAGDTLSLLDELTVPVSGTQVYSIEAIDDFNCREEATVSVSGGPVNVDISGDQIKCTDEPIDVFINNLDLNDSLSINWLPNDAFVGDPTDNPTPELEIVPGEQVLQVEVSNQFGCNLQDSIYVALVDANNTLDFDFDVSCSGSTFTFNNLSNNAYNYIWDFGNGETSTEVSPTVSFDSLGVYMITLDVAFDVACVNPIQQDIEILNPEFIPSFTYEYDSCSTDQIIINFFDNSTNFQNNTNSWDWTFSNGMTSSSQNPTISITESTNLNVLLEIGTENDCVDSTGQSLLVDLIETEIEPALSICHGDTIALNPNGNTNYTYNWSPGDGLSATDIANPIANPTETTEYFVNITHVSADTCSIDQSVLLTVPDPLVVDALGNMTTCGEEVPLVASSNYDPDTDFMWTTLDGEVVMSAPIVVINPETDTTLVLVGTDPYGCVNTDTITVVNESINLNVDFKGEACPEDTILLTAINLNASHDLTLTWEAIAPAVIVGDNTGNTITVVTAPANQNAQFVVSATNQFDCVRTDTVNIFSHNFVPTYVSELMACSGVETALNPGANESLNYYWSPGGLVSDSLAANPNTVLTGSQIFSVMITEVFDGEVCEFMGEVSVEVPTLIEIEAPLDTFTCGTPITICANSNILPESLEWTDSSGATLEGTDCTEVNPEDSETYTILVTDAAGCTAQQSITVSNEEVNLSVINDGEVAICPQDSLTVFVTNLDPDDILTYTWSSDGVGTILSDVNNDTLWVNTPQNTTANFPISVSNQFGCELMENVAVETYEFNAVVEDSVKVCKDIPTALNPNFTPGLLYEWSPAGLLDDASSPNPSATITETTLFNVTITGVNPSATCVEEKEVLVIVNPDINLEIIPSDTVLCEFVDITLTANSDTGLSWEWSESASFDPVIGNNDVITVSPQGSQTYYVRATDDLGCEDVSSMTINAFPLNINLDDIHDFCVENGSILLNIQNNDPQQDLSYSWTPGDFIVNGGPNDNPLEVAVTEDTWFYVTVANQFGCVEEDSTLVQYFDLSSLMGNATADPDTLIFGSGESSQLNVIDIDGLFYEWSPDDGSLDFVDIPNPIAMPEETTVYSVVISNAEGCVTVKDVEVFVKNPECAPPFVFVPSAFSPNGDGENDMLFVRGTNLDEVELVVFNRWGQKVFETNDQNVGWNGTFKGEFLPPDVFGYYLKVKCFNGSEFFQKGNVSLMR